MKLEDIPKQFRGAFGKWQAYHAKPLDQVFWGKVDKRGPEDCWEFRGGRHKSGYGLFYLRGGKFDQKMAHRMAWVFTHGHIPNGLWVLHKCDNPPCCNPAHLFLGTNQDNVDDCVRKGRNHKPFGELSASHKLTERQVLELRQRYHPAKTSYALLAKEFGVSKSTVQHAVTGRKWKYLNHGTR